LRKFFLDYIDPDVAYFIGLVTARGEISDSGGVKRISIEISFQELESRRNREENHSEGSNTFEFGSCYKSRQ